MSNKNTVLTDALVAALAEKAGNEALALNLIETMDNHVMIPAVKALTDQVIIHSIDNRSGAKRATVVAEYQFISNDKAIDTIKKASEAIYSIDCACMSLIAAYFEDNRTGINRDSSFQDWSKVKKAAAEQLGNIRLPQQWDNCWSKVKAAVSVGFNPATLTYTGEDHTTKVRSIYWLINYKKQYTIKAAKDDADKIAEKVTAIAEILADNPDAADITTDKAGYNSILNLCTAVCTRADIMDAIGAEQPSWQDQLNVMLDDGLGEQVLAYIEQYNALNIKRLVSVP